MKAPGGPAAGPERRLVAGLNWLCHAILALGLAAPCMTVTVEAGGATEVAREAGLLPPPEIYSVLSGILALVHSGKAGNVLIGLVLLAFSVLFPAAKLVAVRLALREGVGGAVPPRLLAAVAALSKYSMVDVFVVALLVVAAKTLPGGSRFELEWGLFVFAAAALLSMHLTSAVARPAPA